MPALMDKKVKKKKKGKSKWTQLTLIAVSTLILQQNSSRFISNSHDSSRCWIAVYIITLKKVIWFPRREETAALPLISWTPSAPLVTAAVYSQKEWKKTWPSILNGLDCTEKKNGRDKLPPRHTYIDIYIYLYLYITPTSFSKVRMIFFIIFKGFFIMQELHVAFVSNHKWRKTAAISCQAYFSSAYWVCLMF